MGNIFTRLFQIGKAEAHSGLDSLEDPIKMTEQGIREMKEELNKCLEGLAQVKALVIRSRNEVNIESAQGKDYEVKALALLKKAEQGSLDPAEADRLATEALTKKEQHVIRQKLAETNRDKYDLSAQKLDRNIQKLRSNISSWENELKTLKARVNVSQAQKKINKHLANIDSTSTIEMLERMRDKVHEQEALAESYGEIADANTSIDEEIDNTLAGDTPDSVVSDLERLKSQIKK